MKLDPKLKPLCANLKRLKIGEYLYSGHFDLYALENNLDELWKACLNEIPGRLTFGADYEMMEKAFLHLLNTLDSNVPEKFFEILLPILTDFTEWSSVKLDFTGVIKNLKGLGLNETKLLAFIKDFDSKTKSKPLELTIGKEIVVSNKTFNKVFIVHGHDNSAIHSVARFITDLGFEPIILREKASSSNTIIEKIEKYSTEVDFGIVLYTACDVGAKKGNEKELQNRARQNVVFEHGYLMAKIGRKNVCQLVKGEIETPNDIDGVVYVKMDTNEGWKLSLARELKESGYNVDMNKIKP